MTTWKWKRAALRLPVGWALIVLVPSDEMMRDGRRGSCYYIKCGRHHRSIITIIRIFFFFDDCMICVSVSVQYRKRMEVTVAKI